MSGEIQYYLNEEVKRQEFNQREMNTLNWDSVQKELKGFVYKRVRDKTVTEDIVHDVFLKVQTRIHQVKESDKLFGWIYQITRNTITDHYRKKSRTIEPKEIDWESGTIMIA